MNSVPVGHGDQPLDELSFVEDQLTRIQRELDEIEVLYVEVVGKALTPHCMGIYSIAYRFAVN